MNSAAVLLLMLLVVLSPLPLGSNREWSWTLCALLAGGILAAWALVRGWRPGEVTRFVHPLIVGLFVVACGWVIVQTLGGTPLTWQHPLWAEAGNALGRPLDGRIGLSPDDGWTALMRLASYAAVFSLALLLARERTRARAMLGWIVFSGLLYAVFALAAYWGDVELRFLFPEGDTARAAHGTFVNRNHFATRQGLALLCAIGWLHLRMSRPPSAPYVLPKSRESRVEDIVLSAWLPLTVILLMTAALVLTHSRGGFLATLAATAVLLFLLDSRGSSRRRLSKGIVAAALLVSGLAFYLTGEVLLDRFDRTRITNEERVVVYDNVQRGIAENPLLGFGYGSFADSFRLYDRVEAPVHYDRAHNTWLEHLFELGVPAALALFAAIGGLALTCWQGVRRRHRDWVYPALGAAASVLVGIHALFDFSLQIPAVAILYACILGIGCAQAWSSQPSV